MAKTEHIMLRVDAATKQRLEQASRRAGKTLTDFLLEAADCAATGLAFILPDNWNLNSPAVFALRVAAIRVGGSQGYEQLGYDFASAVGRGDIGKCLSRGAHEEVWNSLCGAYPAHLEGLIPKRRRRQFIQGVLRYYRDQS